MDIVLMKNYWLSYQIIILNISGPSAYEMYVLEIAMLFW